MYEVSDELLEDRLADTFNGKVVLVSGGTGFLGKVLVEKLLRKCIGLKRLILLVRPKRGKNSLQRIEEMFKHPLFATLLSQQSFDQIMAKVTVVNGDTSLENLGLNPDDERTCQTANIVIHSAATVRFDEGLKKAVLLNTRGTKYMLELAKQCSNLEIFIHISTAYCHPDEKVLEERPYPPPADPHEIIDIIERIDETLIDVLTPKLLGIYPNTYAYSKALAEALVEEAMQVLPIIMLRPSVVIPIYKEPIPGWTDNINGPIGLLIGAGKGVIRTMYGDDKGYADFIPVDCVVNVLMLATWDFLINGCHHKVLNLTTSAELKVSWKELLDIGRDVTLTRVPLDNVVWYPGGSMTKSRWVFKIRSLLFHWIPAFFVDAILFCLGYKPVLTRVHRRVSKGMEVFEYYTNHQWDFKSDTIQNVRQKMNKYEKEAYKMDADDLNIDKYFEDGLLAARRYILKEKDENIPRARIHMKMMKYLDILVTTSFYGFVIYFIYYKILSCFL